MLRATIICSDGDSLAEALQRTIAMFDVRDGNGRLKNMLGTTRHMPPHILINAIVRAPGCLAMTAEIQIHLDRIKKITEDQHRYHEVRRASGLSELIAESDTKASKVRQEATFRKSVGDKAPWGLDADALANWLDEHWVNSDALPANQQQERRALAQQLSETDGFELLAACTSEDKKVPWVRISQTKTGEVIHDLKRAQQLTSLLHTQAGLTFYYQLFCASNSITPLHDHEWVRLVHRTDVSEDDIVLCRTANELRRVQFARQDAERPVGEREYELSMKASAASGHVLGGYFFGTTSLDVFFSIAEFAVDYMTGRIGAGQGIQDDDEFWRLASQITSGVADIHQAGILHLAIQVWHDRVCMCQSAADERSPGVRSLRSPTISC